MSEYDPYNPAHTQPRTRRLDIREVISLIGRAMITLGLILLLFVAYQLWGTNFFEARSQNKLRTEFKQDLAKVKSDPTPSTPGDNPVVAPTDEELAQLSQETAEGRPMAIIKIEKIGLDHVVVSGTNKADLQKGPGHYPATPLPGQQGNAAIAGHRTTYGAPFNRLDELTIGDKIVLETLRGTFTYEVSKENKVVSPNDVSVIEPTQDPNDPKKLLPELTLTTCHPKYSAAKRLVIRAQLIPSQAENAQAAKQLEGKDGKLPTTIDIGSEDDTKNTNGIGHSNILAAMAIASFHVPLLYWLLILVAVGGVWWYFFRKYHNWKVWVIGAIPFAIALLFYFIHLEHALPANI